MSVSKRVAATLAILLVFVGIGYFVTQRYEIWPAQGKEMPGHLERDKGYFTVVDESGKVVLTTGITVSPGDQFIGEDDVKYQVESVSGDVAKAVRVGKMEALPPLTVLGQVQAASGKVAIYHTHSDESYVPTDGTETKPGLGGVVKVGERIAEKLSGIGLKPIHDTTSHAPHDAGAYDRSRRTAMRLLREQPIAILDVHRDAGPAEPYIKEVGGREVAKGMIVIGRQNPKMEANLQFARRLKDAVNAQYPGLIKGIFIGNADFNQDLSERALLLEMGTEKTSREAAEAGAALIAEVIPKVVGASTQPGSPEQRGAGRALGWIAGIAVAGVFLYLWISTGSFEEMKSKLMGWFGSGGVKLGGRDRGEDGRS